MPLRFPVGIPAASVSVSISRYHAKRSRNPPAPHRRHLAPRRRRRATHGVVRHIDRARLHCGVDGAQLAGARHRVVAQLKCVRDGNYERRGLFQQRTNLLEERRGITDGAGRDLHQ